jgi:hypothetical protein
MKELERKKNIGARDLAGFKVSLCRRFGNIARAWRDGLDVSGDNKLSYTEFTTACRNISYQGSIKTLFKELDPGTGVITLKDLDYETHWTMTEFKKLLEKRFGNTLQAWLLGLDLDKNLRLDKPEFIERCNALGFEGDPLKLFDMLLKTKESKYLTLGDVDEKAYQAFDHGDFDMIADAPKPAPSSLTFTERQEQHRSHVIRVMVSKDVRHNVENFWKERTAMDMCGTTLDAFLGLLRHRYGSTVAGWTLGLDRGASGRLSWQMFCKGCRSVGFIGDLHEVWRILDDDNSGTVSLMELDPSAGYALKEFRDMMAAKFNSLIEAWDYISGGLTNCDIEMFHKTLTKLGYHRDPRKLFRYLKIERCNKCLLRPDIGLVERIFPREKPQEWHPRWDKSKTEHSTLEEEADIVHRRTLIPGACDSAGRALDETRAESARRESTRKSASPPRSPEGAGKLASPPPSPAKSASDTRKSASPPRSPGGVGFLGEPATGGA